MTPEQCTRSHEACSRTQETGLWAESTPSGGHSSDTAAPPEDPHPGALLHTRTPLTTGRKRCHKRWGSPIHAQVEEWPCPAGHWRPGHAQALDTAGQPSEMLSTSAGGSSGPQDPPGVTSTWEVLFRRPVLGKTCGHQYKSPPDLRGRETDA